MPLPNYPGGTITYQSFAVDTRTLIINNISTHLTASGWTAANLTAYNTLTFTGVPGNNETAVIGAKTYTYKTVLTGAANEVFIGASDAACASNLFDAITDNSGNEGTTYGTGTTANADFTATVASGVLTVTALVAGTGGNGIATFTDGLSNVTFLYTGVSRYGGKEFTSVKTAQGLQCLFEIEDDASDVRCRFGSVDRVTMSDQYHLLTPFAARSLQIRATRYDLWIWLTGSYGTSNCEVAGGTLYLKTSSVPKVVASVASNGGKYEITTSTAHGRTTGDNVYISGATGQTGINGAWAITVVSTTVYTLDGSTYAAGYTANSAVSGGTGEISRCFWQTGSASANQSFRTSLAIQGGMGFVCLNQHAWGTSNGASMQVLVPKTIADNLYVKQWGVFDFILEPMVGWRVTASGATFYRVGMLWGAFVISEDADMDKVKTDPFGDGHNFIAFTDRAGNTTGGLWLATS